MSTSLLARGAARSGAWASRWQPLVWLALVVPPLAVTSGAVLLAGGAVSGVDLSICAGMFVLTLLGIEVGYHRQFAHQSFKTVPAIRILLAGLGSMAFQGSVIWWAGVHRTHHRFADRAADPHSPGDGFLHAHMAWLFKNLDPPGWRRRARDLFRDDVARWSSRFYLPWVMFGLLLPAVAGGWLTRSWSGCASGLLWGGLVRLFLVNYVVWSVNSICHRYGSRPYRTTDQSTNNVWLALPSLGFSWHNNHHAFPRAAVNAHGPWQVDICGLVIQGLARMGLAWDLGLPRASGGSGADSGHP